MNLPDTPALLAPANHTLAHSQLAPVDPDQFAPGESAPPPRPTIRRLFFGEDGLRAGWSVVLFILLVAITSRLSNGLAHRVVAAFNLPKFDANVMTPGRVILTDSLTLLDLLIPAAIMAAIERRPFARFGFPAKRLLPDLATGLFWGLVNLSVLIAALAVTHGIAFDGIAERGTVALTSGLTWFVAFLLVGLSEEFLFRGYLQYTVARGVAGMTRAIAPDSRHAHAIGFWTAAAIFSVAFFMLAHIGNPGETAPGIIGVGLAGLVLVFSLWRTGSLWWAVGWHCAWDWAQTCLFGTADSGNVAPQHILSTHTTGTALLSGGSAGPEGSLLIIPALLLTGLIIHLTLPRRVYPLTKAQTLP